MIILLMFFLFSVVIPRGETLAAYLGDRLLAPSSQGYDVEQLQKDLSYLGYNPGNIDGIFGSQTLAAVKQFQLNSGLAVDGLVGKQTANALIAQVSKPVNPTSPSYAAQTTTPSRSFSLSSQDVEYLAHLIHGEARGECYEGQVAIAAVALNRLESRQFGFTLSEVIFQPGAFSCVCDGQFNLRPDATAYQAAEAALRGWDSSGGAVYFWNPATATSKWIWSRTVIKTIGKHVFAV